MLTIYLYTNDFKDKGKNMFISTIIKSYYFCVITSRWKKSKTRNLLKQKCYSISYKLVKILILEYNKDFTKRMEVLSKLFTKRMEAFNKLMFLIYIFLDQWYSSMWNKYPFQEKT